MEILPKESCYNCQSSLYFKFSAFAWSNRIFEILGNHIGFQSSLADPGVWFKAATYNIRDEYYTYILVYVYDLHIVDKDPRKYMAMLKSKYTLKAYSIGDPKV